MGFTLYYRSLDAVEAEKRASIEAACDNLCHGRTWLSCEPVCFFGTDNDGHIMGGSKPNFMPHADDVASAESEGLPDGSMQDVLNVLCQLSHDHSVDWEISHDDSDGSVGFIRNGQADAEVLQQIKAFGEVGDIVGEFAIDGALGFSTDDIDDRPNTRTIVSHPSRPDIERLKGTWVIDHEDTSPVDMATVEPTYTFNGKSMVMHIGNRVIVSYTVTLDPSKRPKHMDMAFAVTADLESSKGIYQFDDDRLIIWQELDGGDRPTSFHNVEGREMLGIHLKRVR